MKPLDKCLLYTFVDTGYVRDEAVTDVARALCEGGSDLIQLRAKGLDREKVRDLAERISTVLEGFDVGLVINDYPEIAAAVGAPLCHLGQEDFFDSGHGRVDQVAPGGLKVGLSSHAPEQAERAVAAGAAYVAIGPVYATPTKPGRPAVTVEYVRWAAKHLTVPWFAIGGIHLENLDEVLAAGARRVCVVSAILNASNIAKACQAFKQRLLSAS
jgi:thiamine-phosphate pyrophosphorylase